MNEDLSEYRHYARELLEPDPVISNIITDLLDEVERLREVVKKLAPAPARIRGIDFNCEGCGALTGSKRDHKGFSRCNTCGYPSP